MKTWIHENKHFKINKALLDTTGVEILEQLVVDDKARKEGTYYIIDDIDASCLQSYEITTLRLPPMYRAGIQVDTIGTIFSKNGCPFRISYCDNTGTLDINAFRDGALITYLGEQFILPQCAYELVCAVEQWKNTPMPEGIDQEAIIYNRLENIKQLQRLAEEEQVYLPDVISGKTIHTVDRMDIEVRPCGEGLYELRPVLIGADTSVMTQAMAEINNKRISDVRSVSSLKSNEYLLFNKEQRQTIHTCQTLGKATKKDVKEVFRYADVYLPGVFSYDDKIKGINYEYNVKLDNNVGLMSQWVPKGEEFGFKMPDDWEDTHFKIASKSNEYQGSNESQRLVLDYDANITGDGDDSIISIYGKERTVIDATWHHVFPKITLKSYQEEGVRYLQELWAKGYKGALLADDMGLGKTLQTLVFSSWVAEQTVKDIDKPIGIICPVSLMKNWESEYKKFINPSLWDDFLLLQGSELHSIVTDKRPRIVDEYDLEGVDWSKTKFLDINRLQKHKVILMSYDTARNYQISLGLVDWRLLILDEAQYIKNPGSGVSHAIRGFKYDFGLAITGTPVENTWIDLWTILSFCKNSEGTTLEWFKNEFVKPAQESPELLEITASRLKRYIQPYLLRRMKEDVLDELPTKTIVRKKEYMPVVQSDVYLSILTKKSDSADNKEHAFKTLHQMRLASLHPYFYKRLEVLERMPSDILINSSARFIALFNILDDIYNKGEKALIFLRDKKIQFVLKRLIEERYHIAMYPSINGEISGKQRQDIVDTFNNKDGFFALILSVEAGGVGLNIIGANHVIHLSREWNPAKEEQATDRAYRIGQERDVTVYYPMAICKELPENSSFDEVLDQLLERKRALATNAIVPTEFNSADMGSIVQATTQLNESIVEQSSVIDIEKLLEIDDAQLGIVIEYCFIKKGYSRINYNRKKVGADVICYMPTTNQLLVAAYVLPMHSSADLKQLVVRITNEKIIAPIKANNNITSATIKYRIICFDDETYYKLRDTCGISEQYIMKPRDIELLLEDVHFTEGDIMHATQTYQIN